jgi:hypothetical protein
MRKRHDTYKNVIPDTGLPEKRIPGERKIINSNVVIDTGCFQKSLEEKIRLKLEKKRHKESLTQSK